MEKYWKKSAFSHGSPVVAEITNISLKLLPTKNFIEIIYRIFNIPLSVII